MKRLKENVWLLLHSTYDLNYLNPQKAQPNTGENQVGDVLALLQWCRIVLGVWSVHCDITDGRGYK